MVSGALGILSSFQFKEHELIFPLKNKDTSTGPGHSREIIEPEDHLQREEVF